MKHIACYRMPPEAELLLNVAAGKQRFDIAFTQNAEIDWPHFDRLVRKNRLEPLVMASITPEAAAENDVLLKLKKQSSEYIMVALQQMGTTTELASFFAAHHIRALALKGSLLAMELYGNPAMRMSKDIDFLVDPAQFDKAHQLLLDAGWVWHDAQVVCTPKRYKKWKALFHHAEYSKAGLQLELHWQLCNDEYVFEDRNVAFEKLWDGHCAVEVAGVAVNVLGALDNAAYLVLHAAKHGFNRMRWLVDLHKLLVASNWEITSLFSRMMEERQSIAFLETLLLLYRCPQFSVPDITHPLFTIRRCNTSVEVEVKPQLEGDLARAMELTDMLLPILLSIRLEEDGVDRWKYDRVFSVRLGKSSWITTVSKRIQPQYLDWKRFNFPDALYFLYYIVRPFYKVQRVVDFNHHNAGCVL